MDFHLLFSLDPLPLDGIGIPVHLWQAERQHNHGYVIFVFSLPATAGQQHQYHLAAEDPRKMINANPFLSIYRLNKKCIVKLPNLINGNGK